MAIKGSHSDKFTTKTTTTTEEISQLESFDVTCVVGTIILGSEGKDARVAAYELIAEHGAPGSYSFPRADGGMEEITVTHYPPKDAPYTPTHADWERADRTDSMV